jgi:hypothetical protein
LTSLYLRAATQVGDAGLRHLAKLTELRQLQLDGTKVTDAGVKNLAGLTNLEESLGLMGTGVTDAGLVHLRSFKKLRSLDLRNTQVTAAGAGELSRALPKTTILYGQQGEYSSAGPKGQR